MLAKLVSFELGLNTGRGSSLALAACFPLSGSNTLFGMFQPFYKATTPYPS